MHATPTSGEEISPVRAPVAPRAGGEVLPLEDLVYAELLRDWEVAVQIAGPHGSGKTTALRHLADRSARTPRRGSTIPRFTK